MSGGLLAYTSARGPRPAGERSSNRILSSHPAAGNFLSQTGHASLAETPLSAARDHVAGKLQGLVHGASRDN